MEKRIHTQAVSRRTPSAAAVAEALGGAAARPPALPTQKVAPAVEDPALAQLRAERQAQFAADQAATPAAPITGIPTFDPIPDAIQARRAKVAALRNRLGDIITYVRTANAELQPVISDLEDDAEAIKAGELFDPAEARSFLAALTHCIPTAAAPAPQPADS